MGDITLLLGRAREGDKVALDAIFELLHPELRQIAHRRLMRHQRDAGVNTTALVNECYLKLVPRDNLAPADRFPDVLSFVYAWHEAASLETVTQLPENLTNPFKGLRPFRTIAADDFFGRPRQLDLLDEVVRSNGLTAVVGPNEPEA